MADFQETLQSILGNQEAMGQIMALANSLSGGNGQPKQEEPAPTSPSEQENSTGESTGEIPDLSSLLGQVDPGMIQLGMRLFREFQSNDDRNAALLTALRPFLKEDRQVKLDRALQIARVTRLIRVSLKAVGEGRGEEGV